MAGERLTIQQIQRMKRDGVATGAKITDWYYEHYHAEAPN